MRIERIPLARIDPAPYNPRRDLQPGDAEYTKLERSIDEFGLVEPLVWNARSGRLVGGHQRLKVLVARGESAVEVSVVDLPPDKEKALNLALNKVSGAWDEARLAALLDGLTKLPDFDMALTGFDPPEVEDLLIDHGLRPAEAEDFDVNAELARIGAEPVTQAGDLIELGGHRLLCGDCTDPAQVRRLVESGGGRLAVLFATDPPYLVGYDGTNHPVSKRKRRERQRKRLADGNKDWSGTYGVSWDDADEQSELYARFVAAAVAEAVAPDAAWYCWHASRRQAALERVWADHGAFVHSQIVWVKNIPVLTRSWYAWQHEPCFMGWVKGSKPPRRSREVLPTVWRFDTLATGPARPDHPTPKPVELFEIPMRQHTQEGDLCYEPFAGSGTQVIAAERLKRRCLAMEISPVYCDLIVRRWIHFVGPGRADGGLAERYLGAPALGEGGVR